MQIPEYYADMKTWNRIVEDIVASVNRGRPASLGVIDPDSIKITLGENLNIWPASISEDVRAIARGRGAPFRAD